MLSLFFQRLQGAVYGQNYLAAVRHINLQARENLLSWHGKTELIKSAFPGLQQLMVCTKVHQFHWRIDGKLATQETEDKLVDTSQELSKLPLKKFEMIVYRTLGGNKAEIWCDKMKKTLSAASFKTNVTEQSELK